MRKTTEEKLSDIEVRLKRWLTRGMRAQNAINKLVKQQARLKKTPEPKAVVEAKIADTYAPPPPGPDPFDDGGKSHAYDAAADNLEIPPALKVTQADADKMRAERLAKVDKTKMPLTGRDALKAIRRKV